LKAIAGRAAVYDAMTGRGAWWAALAAVSAALLAPLLIADVPPVLDYPNHLARFVLLAAGPDDPVLGPLFVPHWAIIPDLAADVIGPSLLPLLPVHFAGRCILGGILLLNLAGVMALHRALFERRSFWPLASGLVAYNSGFLLGFLNWQIGSGLAMLFAAAWLSWRERRPVATIAGAAAASIVLFFCHLMGLMFFLVLIGGAEAHAVWRRRAALSRGALLLPVVAGPMLLWLLAPLHDARAATHWMNPHEKLVQAASPFINYRFTLDMVSAVLVYGGVALGIATGRLVLAPRAIAAVAVLAVLYVALPFDLMSASFLDTRVALMLGLLLFAVTDPAGLPRRAGRLVAAGLTALFAVRMAVLAEVWAEHRRDLDELRAVIAAVPPKALVYMTNVPQEEAPGYWDAGPHSRRLSNGLRADYHLPALLLIEHGAFWPVLFANPAQQPIRLRPVYARLAQEAHDIPSHAALVADPDHGTAVLRDFDFVLMLEAGADTDPARFVWRCLALVSHTDFAALYRVRHDSAACGGGLTPH
jgi:hypothetical protein